jgi:hypothetical protein
MNNQKLFTCPKCERDDATALVSEIYSHGTSIVTTSGPVTGVTYSQGKWGSTGGYATQTGIARSALATKLAPPAEPTANPGITEILLYIGFSFFIVMGYGSVLFGGGLSAGKTNAFAYTTVCCTAPMALMFFFRFRKRQQAEEAKPAYNEALRRWRRLMYCSRDGTVYDPETGHYTHSDNMMALLYPSGTKT